jgi:UDP-glucose 4-epimerase
MRVLLTGGAGFIGSHTAEALCRAGHQVTVVDDLSTGERANLSERVSFVQCDVAARDLDAIMTDLSPHAVIHCAAQVSVGASIADPAVDAHQNILGTINLLHSAGRHGVKLFLLASSAAVYGIPGYLPLTEEHPTRPLSPYGLSKLAAEWYVSLLAEQYSMRWLIYRFANVVGPRQAAGGDGAVVPAFLSAMFQGRDPVIAGDGEQTRDFVFVEDVAEAHRLGLTANVQGIFHISSGTQISINELWRRCAAIANWQRPPVHGPARLGDIRHSILSPERARSAMGWEAKTDLVGSLSATAAFWKPGIGIKATE